MGTITEAGQLAKRLITEYPDAGSLTLAKRLHKEHPEHFETVENARTVIRHHRGMNGDKKRKSLLDLSNVKDLDSVLRAKMNLPDAAVTERDPYILPKVNKKILVFGDAHFPYQDSDGIYAAIEYGVKKQVDTVIMNGDMIDMYQVSRYIKDGRKPSIDYELDLFYQFLLDLRDIFPKALIIWKYGNHEDRWDAYLKLNAPLLYMTGTMSLEDVIPVNELGIIVVKDKRRIVCGDLNVLHGHEYMGSAGGVNPARTMSLKAKTNCLVNHFHRSSSHKEVDLNGNTTRYYSLGAMCKPQDYAPYSNHDCSYGLLEVVDGVCYVTNREV